MGDGLQLAGATEGTDRKTNEHQTNYDRERNEPVGDIVAPGAQSRVEPAERENGEAGAYNFVK